MITKPPCQDCTQRFVGCHATCEPYKDYKIKHEAEKAERDKQKQEYTRASDTQIAGMKRMQRGRRK